MEDNNINYEYILRYLKRTLRADEGHIEDVRRVAVGMNLPIARVETVRFLQTLIASSNAKRILEIGTAIGYSGLSMLEAAGDDGHLVTVEKSPDLAKLARENFEGKKVELIEGDGVKVLETLDGEFDFAFVDAAKGQYGAMFDNLMRLVKTSGVIVSDNVLYKGMTATDDLRERREITIIKRMRAYLDMLCNDKRLVTSIVPIGDGLAISYIVRKD
ncbi:MAG: O-methyltransferase [Eubacteriales bacterium]|nr:O-methyltransferase [Eubacteriales bacterium]